MLTLDDVLKLLSQLRNPTTKHVIINYSTEYATGQSAPTGTRVDVSISIFEPKR